MRKKRVQVVKKGKYPIEKYFPSQKHPHIIVNENEIAKESIGITHSPKRGKHKNIALTKNPNPRDKKTAYIHDYVTTDNKNRYAKQEKFRFWKVSSEDYEKIEKIAKKKR